MITEDNIRAGKPVAALAGEALALPLAATIEHAPSASAAQLDGSTFTPDEPGRYVLRFASGAALSLVVWPSAVLDVPNLKHASRGDEQRARSILEAVSREASWRHIDAAMTGEAHGLNRAIFGKSADEAIALAPYGGR